MIAQRGQSENIWIENRSAGLKLFLSLLKKSKKPVVLDAGMLSGANIEFLSSFGCKVYTEDIAGPSFDGNLEYEKEQFDGIILWESADKLNPAQAESFFDEIERILRPGGIVFMVTSSQKKTRPEGSLRFRIRTDESFEHSFSDETLVHKHYYTNRELMKMLERFKTCCFNLLKTGNREIVFGRVESG